MYILKCFSSDADWSIVQNSEEEKCGVGTGFSSTKRVGEEAQMWNGLNACS